MSCTCAEAALVHFIVSAGQVGVETSKDAMQLLHLGIGRRILELLGGLRDLILDGRAPLDRVVGHYDIVACGVDDGRKRFVLVRWPLNGLAAGCLEAGAHCGVDAIVIEGQRSITTGIGDQVFEVLARLKALQVRVETGHHRKHDWDGLPNRDS